MWAHLPAPSTTFLRSCLPFLERDRCWSREVGQKVVVAPAVWLLAAVQLQSLALLTKVPGHLWNLCPCILHLQVFPCHGSFSLSLLALLLFSRQTFFGNPSFLHLLQRTSGPWFSPSKQTTCRRTTCDQFSDLWLCLISFFSELDNSGCAAFVYICYQNIQPAHTDCNQQIVSFHLRV